MTDRSQSEPSAEPISREDLVRENAALRSELAALLYRISHDVRAPLRALSGFSGMLERKYGEQLDEKGSHLVARIGANAEELNGYIETLLAYSRLGQRDLRRVDIENVEDLLAQIAEELQANHDRKLHLEIPDPLPTISADPAQLRQALSALVDNAFRFASPDREPTLEVRWEDNAFQFIDNGVGFPEDRSDDIFELFKALGETQHRTDPPGVYGCGLAFARRIAHLHGGSIVSRPNAKVGSAFAISFGVG